MDKKKVCFFSIADKNNMKYFEMLKNSLAKFHPDIPLLLWDEAKINRYKDPHFFYRATPIIAKELIEEYDCVIKLDADQIITGDLSHVWEGEFDVAVVNNSNPRETKAYPVNVWNIHPLAYVNCGFVVMKSKRFIEHWYKQCMGGNFLLYQFREQDLLNILVQYGDYEVKKLDEGPRYHGLAAKGYEPEIKLVEGKLMLYKNEEWPTECDKQIVCYHFAGGNDNPSKGNYKIRFQPDVIEYIDQLVKP